MILNHYSTILCCLIGVLVGATALSSPTPTKSPECTGMNRAKRSLEKGFGKLVNEPIKCLVNQACTGLSCNGTHKGQDFYTSLQLHHCKKPGPEIHLDLIYPSKNLKIHQEIKDGTTLDLYSTPLGKFKLKLSLKREQNKITSSLVVCMKTLFDVECKTTWPLMPLTSFCVNMNTCPKGQFNTTGYVPCHVSPTKPTSISPGTSPTPSPTDYSYPTEPGHGHPNINSTGQSPEPLGAKKHRMGDGHHHLSVGEAIGIGFAVLAAILIVAGVIIYWKKFHHRSRLRAAYYNDISMNDPLYEDFGPEVA